MYGFGAVTSPYVSLKSPMIRSARAGGPESATLKNIDEGSSDKESVNSNMVKISNDQMLGECHIGFEKLLDSLF